MVLKAWTCNITALAAFLDTADTSRKPDMAMRNLIEAWASAAESRDSIVAQPVHEA